MNLLQCVESLSTNTLKRILTYYPDRDFQREEDRSLSFLLDLQVLRQIWQKMEEEEQTILGYFLIMPPFFPVTIKQMNKMVNLPFPYFLAALTRLRRMGFIFTHRPFYGDRQFFLPADLRNALMRIFIDQGWNGSASGVSAPPSDLLQLLYAFLEYVWKNPLPLTQKGLIHKREVARLEKELGLEDDPLSLHLHFGWEEYPPTLSLLLDFAAEEELLLTSGEKIILNQDQMADFLRKDGERLEERMIGYLLKRLFSSAHHTLANFLEWISLHPRGKWVHISSFLQFLLEFHFSLQFSADDTDDWLVREVMKPLQRLTGMLLRKGAKGIEVTLPRYKMNGEASFYLQPNFQFLVPVEASFGRRYRLAAIAKAKERGQMILYELTKESIAFAAEQGLMKEEILALLEELSLSVPENIRHTVAEWADQQGQIKFYDALTLVCRSEELAGEIHNSPALKKYILARLSPTVFIVRRGELKAFRQKLLTFGYAPSESIYNPEGKKEENLLPLMPFGQEDRNRPILVENLFPEWKDEIDWLSSFPRSWFTNQRPYQRGTLIDLLSKSVEYQFYLRMKLKAGEAFLFYPDKLLRRKDRYLLQGFNTETGEENMQVDIDEIERVQGIIPEMLLNAFLNRR